MLVRAASKKAGREYQVFPGWGQYQDDAEIQPLQLSAHKSSQEM